MNKDQSNISRRKFIQWTLVNTAGISIGSLSAWAKFGNQTDQSIPDNLNDYEWGYLIDISRCIGCGSCVAACNKENQVPGRNYRTWVERYEIDEQKNIYIDSPNGSLNSFQADSVKNVGKGFFVPKQCNQCRDSACTKVCPVNATYHSPDGVVLIDKKHCIGCGFCVQACPYGCRYISDPPGAADKCDLCYHRIHQEKTPACVDYCPTQARTFGNLNDPESPIHQILRTRQYSFLRPEYATDPKCYYLDLNPEVI